MGYKEEVVSAFTYAATSMMKQFATDNFSSYNLGKEKELQLQQNTLDDNGLIPAEMNLNDFLSAQ